MKITFRGSRVDPVQPRPRPRGSWTCALAVLAVPASAFAAAGNTGNSAADGGATAVTWFHMFLLAGGPVGLFIIWALVLLSVLCLGFIIRYVIYYRRKRLLPQETYDRIHQSLKSKQYAKAINLAEEDESLLGRLTCAALREANHGYGAMARAIEEASDVEIARMLRPIEYLNVAGNISPMMGLFGTVYGMIVAFQQLVAAGGSPEVGQLAGGISTALITTFWGLVVAIPALAAYALIRNKIDAICSEGLIMAEQLIEPFKPSGQPTGVSSSSAASSSFLGSSLSGSGSSGPGSQPTPQPANLAPGERPAKPGDGDRPDP